MLRCWCGFGIFRALGVVVLVTMGVLSASVWVGLKKNSFSEGFKMLIVTISTFVGLIVGIVGVAVIGMLSDHMSLTSGMVIGAFCGGVAGYTLGLGVAYLFRKMLILSTKMLLTFDK